MSEISQTWDSLYNDIRAILDKIDPKRSQTFPISHALRGGLIFVKDLFQDLHRANV